MHSDDLSSTAGQTHRADEFAPTPTPSPTPCPTPTWAEPAATNRVPAVEILRAGPLTTVQDLGRAGFAHLGVPRSGALDVTAHRLSNRLVGNDPEAATLETTISGLTLRALTPTVVAVCGAVAPVRVDGRPAPWSAPIELRAGQTLDVGMATQGVRNYVAFAGGVAIAPVLGSRSADLLSGLGSAVGEDRAGNECDNRLRYDRLPDNRLRHDRLRDNRLHDGDVLPLGTPAGPPQHADTHPVTVTAPVEAASAIELPVLPGPRPAAFPDAAWQALTGGEYAVSPASNRIALRLEGPPLDRSGPDTIPSEGTVLGAIQVPADGRPIIFLADHPPTGGYPVIGVVPAAALGSAAQAPPGTRIRFRAQDSAR